MNEFELTTELIQIRSLLLNFIISNEVFKIAHDKGENFLRAQEIMNLQLVFQCHVDILIKYYCILCFKFFPSFSTITIMKRDLKKYITSLQVCFQKIWHVQ